MQIHSAAGTAHMDSDPATTHVVSSIRHPYQRVAVVLLIQAAR